MASIRPDRIRGRIRRALRGFTLNECEIVRPARDLNGAETGERTTVGTVTGYLYHKKGTAGWMIAMPGQMVDAPDGTYLLALYPDALPDAQKGDILTTGETAYEILSVSNALGAYDLYRLREG